MIVEEDEPETESSDQRTGIPSVGPEDTAKPGSGDEYISKKHTTHAAENELRIHELLALTLCFMAPILGAWLLHAIRSQLSRRSEDLISNYNLTIFILATEIRPLSHLVKLIQGRTLFLQRLVHEMDHADVRQEDEGVIVDIRGRIEDLERHAASISESKGKTSELVPDVLVSQAVTRSTMELRKNFQPELDALSRAMRRYEKRSTISAIQIESRLQDLETQLRDVVVLAAAAQRNVDRQPRNFIVILTNWLCAVVVIPLQWASYLLHTPPRFARWAYHTIIIRPSIPDRKRRDENKIARAGMKPRERKIKQMS